MRFARLRRGQLKNDCQKRTERMIGTPYRPFATGSGKTLRPPFFRLFPRIRRGWQKTTDTAVVSLASDTHNNQEQRRGSARSRTNRARRGGEKRPESPQRGAGYEVDRAPCPRIRGHGWPGHCLEKTHLSGVVMTRHFRPAGAAQSERQTTVHSVGAIYRRHSAAPRALFAAPSADLLTLVIAEALKRKAQAEIQREALREAMYEMPVSPERHRDRGADIRPVNSRE
ncbi:hypothetical protein BCh11DRAFT_02075 [Burkholderia sp. Ch1-1]|uniref:Uncharacterized protein n=1 Tax=Paraburkholderia dioscoreae TaxID=2604047 RepID=A0A5Q4Z3D8_9BURK|nr:hypothetical protein BCh11DRAFT_02075 [Burkholderia sp. Ch1-1]VVD33204.1 conserved protein of unknown function [Paraburkholderia dioscoreae]